MNYWWIAKQPLALPDAEELEARFIADFNEVRQRKKKLSQMELSQISEIKQPVISKISTQTISPCLKTIFKLLRSMNKTIVIVDIEDYDKVRKYVENIESQKELS